MPYSFGSVANVTEQGRQFACNLATVVPTIGANIALSMYLTNNVSTPPPLTTTTGGHSLDVTKELGCIFQLLWARCLASFGISMGRCKALRDLTSWHTGIERRRGRVFGILAFWNFDIIYFCLRTYFFVGIKNWRNSIHVWHLVVSAFVGTGFMYEQLTGTDRTDLVDGTNAFRFRFRLTSHTAPAFIFLVCHYLIQYCLDYLLVYC